MSVGREKEYEARKIMAHFSKLDEHGLRRLTRHTLCSRHLNLEEKAVADWSRILRSDALVMARSLLSDCKLIWNSTHTSQSQAARQNEAESQLARDSGRWSRGIPEGQNRLLHEFDPLLKYQIDKNLTEEKRRQWNEELLKHEKARRHWMKECLDHENTRHQWAKDCLDHEKIRHQWEKERVDHENTRLKWENERVDYENARHQWEKDRFDHDEATRQWEQERCAHETISLQWEDERRQWDLGRALHAQKCVQRQEQYHRHEEQRRQLQTDWTKFVQVWDMLGSLSIPLNGTATNVLSSWPNKVSMRLLRSEAIGEGFFDNLVRTSSWGKHGFSMSMRRSLHGNDGGALWASARFAHSAKAVFTNATGIEWNSWKPQGFKME